MNYDLAEQTIALVCQAREIKAIKENPWKGYNWIGLFVKRATRCKVGIIS